MVIDSQNVAPGGSTAGGRRRRRSCPGQSRSRRRRGARDQIGEGVARELMALSIPSLSGETTRSDRDRNDPQARQGKSAALNRYCEHPSHDGQLAGQVHRPSKLELRLNKLHGLAQWTYQYLYGISDISSWYATG
jgi:hypothetical protein